MNIRPLDNGDRPQWYILALVMSPPPNLLSSIRVIDCGTYIAGPAAATVMADFGAEVIKVERPPAGDPYRYLSRVPIMPASDLLYCWILDGRNRRSVALNLEKDAARDALLKLVASADVFITNYQPSILQKFRITWDDFATLNDRLIYAHVTGYGDNGEDVEKPGYDMTAYWARSGLMGTMRYADADPCPSVPGFGDHPTSMIVFGGVMLGLYRRGITGKGMKVSTSLLASGAWSNACLLQAALVGARFMPEFTRQTSPNPIVNHYVSREGKRFIICCVDPDKDWRHLSNALGRPELASDERFRTPALREANAKALISIIDQAFASQDMESWSEIFAQHDIVWGPVPQTSEASLDPQMEANGIFSELKPGLRTVSSPLNVSGVDKVPPSMAPQPGEHTIEVLQMLGYSDGNIEDLLRSGAAMAAPTK